MKKYRKSQAKSKPRARTPSSPSPIQSPAGPAMSVGEDAGFLDGLDASHGRSGPTGTPMDDALTDAFGDDVQKLPKFKQSSSAAKQFGAQAFTEGKQVHLGSGVRPESGDRHAMAVIGEEVAHALAGGGSGKTRIDQPGDPGEASAKASGKAFANMLEGGAVSDLKPATGGQAQIHRHPDEGNDSDDKEEASNDKEEKSTAESPKAEEPHGYDEAPVNHTPATVEKDRALMPTVSGPATINAQGVVTAKRKGTSVKFALGEERQSETSSNAFTPDSTIAEAAAPNAMVGDAMNINSTHAVSRLEGGLGLTVKGKLGVHGGGSSVRARSVHEVGMNNPEARKELLANVKSPAELAILGGQQALPNSTGMTFSTETSTQGGAAFGVGGSHQSGSRTDFTVFQAPNGNVRINAATTKKDATDLSAGIGVLSVGAGEHLQKRESITFDVDPKKLGPEGQKALLEFQKTGLLPGAKSLGGVSDPEVAKKNQDLVTTLDGADTKIAEIKTKMEDRTLSPRDRSALRRELEEQEAAAQTTREQLNEAWKAEHGLENGGGGKEVVPGVTLVRESNQSKRTQVADFSLGAELSVGGKKSKQQNKTRETSQADMSPKSGPGVGLSWGSDTSSTSLDGTAHIYDGELTTSHWTKRGDRVGEFRSDGKSKISDADGRLIDFDDSKWSHLRTTDAYSKVRDTHNKAATGRYQMPYSKEWDISTDAPERDAARRGARKLRSELEVDKIFGESAPDHDSNIPGVTAGEKLEAFEQLSEDGDVSKLSTPLQEAFVDRVRRMGAQYLPSSGLIAATEITDPHVRAKVMADEFRRLPSRRVQEMLELSMSRHN